MLCKHLNCRRKLVMLRTFNLLSILISTKSCLMPVELWNKNDVKHLLNSNQQCLFLKEKCLSVAETLDIHTRLASHDMSFLFSCSQHAAIWFFVLFFFFFFFCFFFAHVPHPCVLEIVCYDPLEIVRMSQSTGNCRDAMTH